MELTGKIIAILPKQGGVSAKGNNWVRFSFVIETQEQYPKKVLFTCTDNTKWNEWGIEVGKIVQVSFNVNAREWNNKWFNDVEAWRVVSVNGTNTNNNATNKVQPNQEKNEEPKQVAKEPSPQPQQEQKEDGSNDLPF